MKIIINKVANLLRVTLSGQNHEDKQGIHLIANAMNPGGEPAGPDVNTVEIPVAGEFVDNGNKDKGLADSGDEKNKEGGGNSGQSESGETGKTNN